MGDCQSRRAKRRRFARVWPDALSGTRRVRWGLYWGRRWGALRLAVGYGLFFSIVALACAVSLLSFRVSGWAWLALVFDPIRAIALLAGLAWIFPQLGASRRATYGNVVGLALVYTALLPVGKALFDGPTLPVVCLGPDRRVDGVWFDPGTLLVIATVALALGAVTLWARFRIAAPSKS